MEYGHKGADVTKGKRGWKVSDPEPRAVAVCSPGNVELLKGSCQSLVKIRPLFQAFMGVAVSKMQRER